MTVPELHARYSAPLEALQTLLVEEAAHWSWDKTPHVDRVISEQIRRPGKRLRPITAFTVAELLGSDACALLPTVASVEFYHLATLLFDDIEDGSASRDGVASVHVSSGLSLAINAAGILRSFASHAIHRSARLSPARRTAALDRLHTMETTVPFGQSADIGWREGRYGTYKDFPYLDVARRKTGALFGYAAWLGAFVTTGDERNADRFTKLGQELGILYQLRDDHEDLFASREGGGVGTDLAERNLTYPLITLLRTIEEQGREKIAAHLAARLRDGLTPPEEAEVLQLLAEYGIEGAVEREIRSRAGSILEKCAALAPSTLEPMERLLHALEV